MNDEPDNSQLEQAPRLPNGQLMPGAKLNPNGRPIGSGSGLAAVMRIVSEIANGPEFRAAMQAEARRNPLRYARAVVLPLTPQKHRRELRQIIRNAELAAFGRACEKAS